MYVRYNTRLREISLQRKQNVDSILVDEIDLDDEWIAKKEDPLFLLDLCWLEDNKLFNIDAIKLCRPKTKRLKCHWATWFQASTKNFKL